ncbi:MAG: hypothetical protein U9M92_01750 [Patescibacteria group bacterium]|nr:hypothetical protein [Patescibacteria group bacterium]
MPTPPASTPTPGNKFQTDYDGSMHVPHHWVWIIIILVIIVMVGIIVYRVSKEGSDNLPSDSIAGEEVSHRGALRLPPGAETMENNTAPAGSDHRSNLRAPDGNVSTSAVPTPIGRGSQRSNLRLPD